MAFAALKKILSPWKIKLKSLKTSVLGAATWCRLSASEKLWDWLRWMICSEWGSCFESCTAGIWKRKLAMNCFWRPCCSRLSCDASHCSVVVTWMRASCWMHTYVLAANLQYSGGFYGTLHSRFKSEGQVVTWKCQPDDDFSMHKCLQQCNWQTLHHSTIQVCVILSALPNTK